LTLAGLGLQDAPMSAAPSQPEIAATRSQPPPAPATDAYRRYALALLLVVYILNFVDRQILNILAEAIRVDLGLSDAALGFLGGPAFAVFYTFAGIPIARWADRGVRRSIVALGLLGWSAMTAASGLARSFTHLALARVGVGLGEAACSPPAHSMLSDYYPPEKRGTAFSIYALGIPIGSAIGTFTGGWLMELFDWRTAFFVVGLPGIALALVVRLTLREPPRRDAQPAHATRDSLAAVLRYMQRLASFRHMSLAAALHAFYGYGAGFFLPVFMIRVHGFSEGELSTWLALIALVAGGLGTFLGGFVCDRLAPRDQRWYVWVPAIATAIAIPFSAGLYLSPDRYVALGFAIPAVLLGSMYLGPTFAISQGLARPHMRALVSAILLFIINLVGLGLGPQAVGALSDLLKPAFEVESVRYALLYTVAIGAAWSTLHYALAGRTLRADLAVGRAAD
jgi:MFS family permease